MNKKKFIKKFKNDIKKRHYLLRLLLSVDQFFNVLILNGSQDETISSHVGRKMADGSANVFHKGICSFCRVFESRHCKKSIGE
jgi:hypothetical protein